MNHTDRDRPLEALRGLAAMTVLLWHVMLGFFPDRSGIFPGSPMDRVLTGEVWFGLINGSAAVILFFTLSGYVLTRRYCLDRDDRLLLRGAVKRWPRLLGPVLASVLISWALFRLDLYAFEAAAEITGSPWLAKFAYAYATPFQPDLGEAVMQGALLTFMRGDSFYNSSLWTMRYEFFGSFGVFIAAFVATRCRIRPVRAAWIAACGAVAIAVSPNFVPFVVGLALAMALPRERKAIPLPVAMVLIAAAIVLMGYSAGAGGVFAFASALPASAATAVYIHTVAAAALMVAVHHAGPVREALSGTWAEAVGDLSFPLYLVHVLVLCSAGSWLCVTTAGYAPHEAARWAGAAATVVVSIVAALPLIAFNGWWLARVNAAAARFV
jgi:peptidoglycan/LPS O-acetylase OafA/YrhL